MARKKFERSLKDLGGALVFDLGDVMKVTGFGETKISNAWKCGDLKCFLFGGSRRFHSIDVWKWAWDLRNNGLERLPANDLEA